MRSKYLCVDSKSTSGRRISLADPVILDIAHKLSERRCKSCYSSVAEKMEKPAFKSFAPSPLVIPAYWFVPPWRRAVDRSAAML